METLLGGLAVCLFIAVIVLHMRRSAPRSERDLGLTPLPGELDRERERERERKEADRAVRSWSPRA